MNTLYNYYSSQGLNLPSIQERAATYEQKGLGKASDYKGTSSQNAQLFGSLNPNSMQGNKPVAAPAVITAENAQNKVNTATQNINSVPVNTPKKKKTSEDYSLEVEGGVGEYEDQLKSLQKQFKNLNNGVIKYTADEQATLNQIEQATINAKNAQERFNRQAARGTGLLSVGEFAPVRQQSAINETIQSGLDQLKTIDLEGAAKLGEARTAIRNRRFDEIVKTNNEIVSLMDKRNSVLRDMRDYAFGVEKDARDYAFEREKFSYQQAQDAKEFAAKYGISETDALEEAQAFGTVDAIDKALGNKRGLGGAVGVGLFSRAQSLPFRKAASQRFIGAVEQIAGQLTIDKLIQAKASGATFGALSDGEQRLLAASASKLGSWAIKDSDGKTIGWKVSEKDVKKELENIKKFAVLDYEKRTGKKFPEEGMGTVYNGVQLPGINIGSDYNGVTLPN